MNQAIARWYEENSQWVAELSQKLWSHPELAMEEAYACQTVAQWMEEQGFQVRTFPVKEGLQAPNVVQARWGSGKPVIGIIGEYDALADLGQEAVPHPAPIQGPGHGCGHNLMGSGCAAAAAALKAAMEAEQLPGTVVYLACPAEETLEGKGYMDAQGLFDELDVALAWHPLGGKPMVVEFSFMATNNYTFEFFGKTAQAGAIPWEGRSALDAAELMNIGVQYLREHVKDGVRMHYGYLSAPSAANIVPGYAALNYYVRAHSSQDSLDALARIQDIALGAAKMTGTRVEWKKVSSTGESKVNHTLNRLLYASYEQVPPIQYTEEEKRFAHVLYEEVTGQAPQLPDGALLPVKLTAPTGQVVPGDGSSDLTYVMHRVPTAWIFGYGNVLGMPGHHWAQTATAGMSIGQRGALYAGKILAQCGYNLLKNPQQIQACWEEFRRQK